MPELAPGDIFAGHRIEGVAGRGGFGVVYRATHLALDHVVALKLISGERAADATFRERFQSESRIAVSIRHPNVVAVHHAGEEDGLLFVTMDFIEGTDLRGLLNREGRLDAEEATAIISPVASALDAAHEKGLVHRDIKPGNVLIEERGGSRHVFLTDFGLSKKIDATSGVTASGAFVGTLDYVAPEQIKGDRVDARTDVYALGCVLYELLTGEVPFGGEIEKVAKMYAHLQEAPPSLAEKAPDAPGALGDVVWRAMEKDPDSRFPSAGDLARAARAAAEGRQPSQPERRVGSGAAAPPQAFAGLAAAVAGGGEETAEAAPPAETAEATPPETMETPTPAGETAGVRPVKPGSDRYPRDSERYPDSPTAPHPREAPTEQPPRPPSKTGGGPRRGLILAAVAAAAVAIGAFALLSGGDGGGGDGGGDGGGSKGGGGSSATAEVTGDPIKVPPYPESVAIGEGAVFVSSRDGQAISRIDPKTDDLTQQSLDGNGEQVTFGSGSVWVVSGEGENGAAAPLLHQLDPDDLSETGTFPVGSDPRGVALTEGGDGAWVANYAANTATRVRLDGSAVPFGVGVGPTRVAAGAESIWVANTDGDSVTRIQKGGNAISDPISVGKSPHGMVFADGLLWVALSGDDSVVSIDPDGNMVGPKQGLECDFPTTLAFGFESLWLTCKNNKVLRLDPSSGKLQQDVPGDWKRPEGIAVDEANHLVWVTNGDGNSVQRIDPGGD